MKNLIYININYKYVKTFYIFIILFCPIFVPAQSFNDEKTAAINFIKRLYATDPFEGAKKIEGQETNYYTIALLYKNISHDSTMDFYSKALIKAQNIAEQSFTEPCVKFEMIERIESSINNLTFLFLCETLNEFVIDMLRKKTYDGARIVSAPNTKYVISTITLENDKYYSTETRDKIANMKAKQQVNTLLNGSTITSDVIIRTDGETSKVSSDIEYIREQAMGFINGLELLQTYELIKNKTTYIYYCKI